MVAMAVSESGRKISLKVPRFGIRFDGLQTCLVCEVHVFFSRRVCLLQKEKFLRQNFNMLSSVILRKRIKGSKGRNILVQSDPFFLSHFKVGSGEKKAIFCDITQTVYCMHNQSFETANKPP
jgi:hypothetical protein